jgi:hypothetical protein
MMNERETIDGSAVPKAVTSSSRRVPELNHGERQEVVRRKNISAAVVYETVILLRWLPKR